jgi:5-(carboxyamino)imidazole ribonucleotide synthase
MKSAPQIKIGLLGSGQLARMLALRAHSLGLIPHVYGGSADDPAAQVSAYHTPGDLKDFQRIEEFLKGVDVATFESEFMDGRRLKELSRSTKTPIWPEPLQMEGLQDRLSQKNLLLEQGMATSPFLKVSRLVDLEKAREAFFPAGFVLKKRKFGYDGYGTFVIRSDKDFEAVKSKLDSTAEGFIAEAVVKFKRELAISAVRNKNGQVVFLPLVESFQKDSRCFWVKGPVAHSGLKRLKGKIKTLLNEIDYIGIMAFELFDAQ